MADFSALLDKFFKAASIEVGQKLTLTIKEVKLAEVGMDKESKPVVFFMEDPRGLVLSAAKYNDIATKAGSRDTDKWGGIKVTLHSDPTIKYGGKITGGIVMKVL